MAEPRQTCTTCGDVEACRDWDRGFPPDAAKRRLAKRCKARGHVSTPTYRAGMSPEIEAWIALPDAARATVSDETGAAGQMGAGDGERGAEA